MTIAHGIARLAGEALASVRAGVDTLAARRFELPAPTLVLTSDSFENGGPLPPSATSDGEGIPPRLEWSEPPEETRELVLLCEDPDAPKPQPFLHWLVYDISADARALDAAGAEHARVGMNSKLKAEFTPAAPPPGHGIHHYHFQLFALDVSLALEAGEAKIKVLEAMEGHVIAYGELVGTYLRD